MDARTFLAEASAFFSLLAAVYLWTLVAYALQA